MTRFDRPARCGLILLALSLLYFARVWLHPKEIVYAPESDILVQHYPWRLFAATYWQAKHALPLWCPYVFGGQPFQADIQTTLFYPPHVAFLLVPPSWVAPLFGYLIWAHVLIAGLGMFLYARVRGGLGPFSALVAAVGFMFAGKWLLHLLQAGHYVFVTLAWFPLLLLLVERAIGRRSIADAVAAGGLWGMAFTGSQPQLFLYLGLLAGLLSLRPALDRGDSGTSIAQGCPRPRTIRAGLGSYLLTWAIVGLVASSLAAVQLLPSLEFLMGTNRTHTMKTGYKKAYEMQISGFKGLVKCVLSLLGPRHYGSNPWEGVGAFGVLWAGVVVLALVLCRRAAVWFYAGILLLMILFALGSSTPVYPALCRAIPGLALFRIPSRMLLCAGFPLGMLAGSATQSLFGMAPTRGRALRRATGLFAALLVAYLVASMFGNPQGRPYVYLAFLTVAGPAMAGILMWCAARPKPGAPVALAWLILLTADLWALHGHVVRTRPVDQIYPVNDVVRFLIDHPGHYRVLDRPMPTYQDEFPALSPLNQALCFRHRIEWVRGYNPSDLFSYKQYLDFVAGRALPPDLTETPVVSIIRNQALMDLLSVRYLFSPASLPLAPGERRHWRYVRTLTDTRAFLQFNGTRGLEGGVYAMDPYVVYERVVRLPRAFVVSRADPLPTDTGPLRALLDTDLGRTVLLEGPSTRLEPLPGPTTGAFPDLAYQEAEVVLEEPDRVVVEVTRSRPGYLVLLDVWYPGWKCRDSDGKQLPIWRANTLFRAVLLSPGRHRLEFVFDPAIYRLGRRISLITLAGFLGLAARQSLRHPARRVLSRVA